MATELYKKYRPKTLDRVTGNHETVSALRAYLAKGKLPHTLLFSGPSGCGKTTLGRIVRRELKCHDLDFVELNCSTFRGIDTVREIARTMNLSPAGGACRVWLLDEVHQLTKEAQDSALKMLEDTPKHVYFFLCTTHPQKLIPTIRNRCTPMPVRLLSSAELQKVVGRVVEKEGLELKDEVVQDLLGRAQGSARAALVMLDKVRQLAPKDQLAALEARADEEKEAIELCRLLIKRAKWPTIATVLKTVKGDPESVRRAVLGYARAVLLGQGNHQAYATICAFEGHFFESGEAGLARACYEAIHGD